ncbi:aminoglycoside phosphotransferase family protein [Luteimonas lutimaris]|uniref:Aminoglycoside phosphotransferase family protein n=1 Tax=Luteimonas lutimaris TaxID=698645 RepID=A0ABP7MDW1_9GAMM
MGVGEVFEPWLRRWQLRPDGDGIVTPGSDLLPVRLPDGTAAMLKIARDRDERAGAALMQWWDGDGAARVFALEGDALLMERAQGAESLMAMALQGRDDAASRIACDVVARLHAPRSAPWPHDLVPLERWFAALRTAAGREGGVFARAQTVADDLLVTAEPARPLHGDIHHGNVLDFGARGWLAIDPKYLVGNRGYDYANLLCNPELPTVTHPARFSRQVEVIAAASGLAPEPLLRWTLAYAGLSAAWFLEDGDAASAASDLAVAGLALAALG